MMDVDYVLLADAVTVADNKQYIHGAAWDTIGAFQFPVVQPSLNIASLIRVPWNDANMTQMLELDVVDADGVSILPTPPGPPKGPITVGRSPQMIQGADTLVPLAFSLVNMRFDQPGTYAVLMRIDGVERKRFPFHVRLMSQMQQPTLAV